MTSVADTIWDAGAQPERVLLAWRRTMLTAMVGAAIALRVAPEAFGVAGLATAGLALAAAVVGGVASELRYRALTRTLGSGDDVGAASVALVPATAVVVCGIAGLSAAMVLGRIAAEGW